MGKVSLRKVKERESKSHSQHMAVPGLKPSALRHQYPCSDLAGSPSLWCDREQRGVPELHWLGGLTR